MVGTSKILTVSYGTFSCTLEGFDDSFNTMKAIAEYFRGLASDDRYFGAEPPTPDAEMLAQIAEREISRRVDASMDDSGIVLRAAALTDQSDAPSDADAPKHDKASRAEVEAARKAAKAARKAKRAKAKAAKKAARKAELAAKEQAEAEANAKADAGAKADADAKAADTAKSDDTDTSDSDDTASDLSILSSVSTATAEPTEGTAGSEVEETRDDASSSMLAADDPAPDNTPPAHPDADSLAAKLQRIRAVVDNTDSSGETASDDLTEQFLPQAETPDVADIETRDDVIGDPVAELDAHEAEIEQAEKMADANADDGAVDESVADDSEVESPADSSDDGSDMISRVMSGHPQTEDDADHDASVEDSDEVIIDGDADSIETDAELDDDDPVLPQARVIRMKRADFEKAVENGDINIPSDTSTPLTGPNLGLLDGAEDLDDYLEDSDFTDSNLSGADSADLAEDLAAIEADFAPDDLADEDPAAVEDAIIEDVVDLADVPDDTTTLDAVSDAILSDDVIADEDDAEDDASDEDAVVAEADEDSAQVDENDGPQVDDAALDRLMSETDAQMQEPEGSRRRDAIAQLKAAVAAKEAARQVGDTDDDGQDAENAFRNDLSEAVHPEGGSGLRPRPVVLSGNRTERPRPAPLKLVAAQRIDLADSEKRDTPVVPRRVAARHDDAQQQAAGSFAEFAENMGASELPDLLEAAAAYTAFVEGADEFSRPQILRRVRAVASDEFNREDGLRSFADLLKMGRFTKVRNGRFQVADDSRFNPERRAG